MRVRPVPFAAFLIAISLVGGYYAGSKSKLKAGAPSGRQVGPTLEKRTIKAAVAGQPERKEKFLQSVLAELKRTRALAAAERHALEEQLAASDARLISLQRDHANALQQSQETDREAKEGLAASRKENEALRKRITETEAILATQDRRVQQLQNELQTARGQLQDHDGQRAAADQQPAKGQLRDLVTATHMHILDQYDADGGGHREASFCRLLYVAGNSLPFYAYDLLDTP